MKSCIILFSWENTDVLVMMKKEMFLNLILLRNYGEATDVIFLYTVCLSLSRRGKDVSEMPFSGDCVQYENQDVYVTLILL